MRLRDLTNRRFSRWTVIRRAAQNTNQNKPRWLCKCDCGHIGVVQGDHLRGGRSRSCGCLQRELMSVIKRSHGQSIRAGTSLYRTWKNMKTRATNPNVASYKNYGGRGISIYEPWIHSFEAFRDWANDAIGPRPIGATLDRIDNNGNYEPNNLRWTTRATQSSNRRNVKDLVGRRFGRLTVTKKETHRTAQNKIRWICQCDCGKTTIIVGAHLCSSHTRSCGCMRQGL